MKYENKDDGVDCKENIALRSLPYILWILMALWFNSGSQGATPLFWIFWVYLVIMISIYDPDFVLYEEGIRVKIWWMRPFVKWEQVRGAYEVTFGTRIRVRSVTPSNFIVKLLLNSGFFITAWRDNYEFIQYTFKRRLGNRFYER